MNDKWWSVLFGVVLFAAFALFAVAPFMNWWLPPNIATFGDDIDFLFYVILGFTGFFFVLTEVILVWAMFRYTHKPGTKSAYVEGNNKLELAWTIVPAAILLYIAFAQVPAWIEVKYPKRMPEEPDQVLRVHGRQWEWRIHYPTEKISGPQEAYRWANQPRVTDIQLPNELHCWKNSKVLIFLETQDVLHSFFLPNLRLKQDAVPGKVIPMWFEATEHNVSFKDDFDMEARRWKWQLPGDHKLPPEKNWEIACAELCGGGHYRMRGQLFVHKDRQDYEDWLKFATKRATAHTLEEAKP